MRADILALPLLFLAPLVSAGSGSHKVNKRAHRQHAARSLEQQRDLEIAQSNHNATLAKRQSFTGRGTYYITGLGACGINNGFNDYIVALNSAQYGGGYPGPQCFKTITIQANGVTVGGVQITDECPTCDWGGLDLSGSLFQRFASLDTGVIQLTWWFDGSNPQPQPTTTQQPAPTTTWTPPSSTWSPPASTWSPPPEPSTTWTPPSSSSAWVAPSSSTTTPPPPPSSSSSSTSSSASSSSYSSSASFNATANPFAVVSSYNGTASSTSASLSASASASASSSATGGGNGAPALQVQGNNLEALNGLVTNYGQIIVVGAGGV